MLSNFITKIAAELDGATKMFGWRIAVIIESSVVRAYWTNRRASHHAFRPLSCELFCNGVNRLEFYGYAFVKAKGAPPMKVGG